MGESLSKKKSLYYFFLCCVTVLHMAFLFLNLFNLFNKGPSEKIRDKKTLRVNIIDEPQKRKRQIVRSEDSKEQEEKEFSYLSDKTRSFEKQKKARVKDSYKTSKTSPAFKKQKMKNLKFSDLAPVEKENPYAQSASTPKSEKLAPSSDYLKEIPVGDVTNLNTIEMKYYGFYHRVREKIEQFWQSSLSDKTHQMRMMGKGDILRGEFITALRVVLDPQGKILKILILSKSGIKEFDEAAVESFNNAGPFPFPPKGLVKQGQVVLEWGFVVEGITKP